jgi:transcriptional regulator with XRE-family HTH domain
MDFAARMSALMRERGLGVRALARKVPCDQALISRLANGKVRPSAQIARRLDEVLDAGGALVALARQDGEDVIRREFIGASATLAVGAALPRAGNRVGMDFADRLALRVARLRGLDDYLGGSGTYELYAAELDATLGVLRNSSYAETTGCALLSIAAEQAQQAGWAAFDAGWTRYARWLYHLSLSAATQAGDAPLAANSLILLAYQQVSSGQPGTQAATAACRMADTGGAPPVARALIYGRTAWTHAVAGQDADCERALSSAENTLADSKGQVTPGWAAWADQSEFEIMSGRCWSVLRMPRKAIPVLEGALAGFDDTRARDKALYMTWLAEAYLDMGEIEQAAATTGRVLALADGIGSVRPGKRAAVLAGRLAPYRSSSDVAEVLDLAASLPKRQVPPPGSAIPGTGPSLPRSARR